MVTEFINVQLVYRVPVKCVCRSRFTSIAVDWRVLAADRRRYDVIFIGTGPRRKSYIKNSCSPQGRI